MLAQIPRLVYIPVFRTVKSATENTWNVEVLHNLPDSPSAELSVTDVILRSISLPTVFPSYQGYCDGGLVATNPSLTALGHTLGASALAKDPSDVAMFSLGSGRVIRFIADATHDWGEHWREAELRGRERERWRERERDGGRERWRERGREGA